MISSGSLFSTVSMVSETSDATSESECTRVPPEDCSLPQTVAFQSGGGALFSFFLTGSPWLRACSGGCTVRFELEMSLSVRATAGRLLCVRGTRAMSCLGSAGPFGFHSRDCGRLSPSPQEKERSGARERIRQLTWLASGGAPSPHPASELTAPP